MESIPSFEDRLTAWVSSSIKLLDIRPSEVYKTRRLSSQRCLNLPAEQITSNCFQLPPREKTFGLVAETKEAFDYWITWLIERDWRVDKNMSFCEESDFLLWEMAESKGVLENENDVVYPCFIFDPCHLLAENIDFIESYLEKIRLDAGVSSSEPFECCDVGCGCGRDSLWLASRSKSWSVLCCDYVAPHLHRICESSVSYNLPLVRCSRIKILDDGSVRIIKDDSIKNAVNFDFSQTNFDLVLCVRFLERNFMRTLKDMVRSGGFIVYLTFTKGAEEFEHPKNPKCILEENELLDTFSDQFETIINRVDHLPDGRPVQAYIGRKL